MNIDHNKFTGIKKIIEYFGNAATTKFSQICTVTGRDTTCFFIKYGRNESS